MPTTPTPDVPPPPVIMTATTGNENANGGSCQLHLFIVGETFTVGGPSEMHVGRVYDTPNTQGKVTLRKRGSMTFESAIVGIKPEIGGKWITQQFDAAEGTLLKIYAQRKVAWNTLESKACVFLRVRADAPLNRVTMKTLQNHPPAQSRHQNIGITGRFDVLPYSQALAQSDVKVPGHLEKFYFDMAVRSALLIEELEPARVKPELLTRTILKGDNGEVIEVKERKRIRALNFGKQ